MMIICRALLVIAIVALTLQRAGAQFGGMPGMPGSPGNPGFSGPPAAPPAKCQALLTVRDEVQRHGEAIGAANKRKADVKVACRLFQNYIASEGKMLKMLVDNANLCGVPQQVIQEVRTSHAKAQQIGKQVCDAAARPVNAAPTLSDALGTTPALPDTSQKKGAGTFETLTGNPFAR